jgi:hypothetical protein
MNEARLSQEDEPWYDDAKGACEIEESATTRSNSKSAVYARPLSK